MNGPLAYNKTGIIVVHAKASTVQYRLNRETENTKGIFKTIICRQSDNTLAKNQNDQKTTNSIQAAQHKKKIEQHEWGDHRLSGSQSRSSPTCE